MCQAAKVADTPGHQRPSGHARQGSQHSSGFGESLLGLVLDTKVTGRRHTRRLAGILAKLGKKRKRPTGARNNSFKIKECELAALLPLASARSRRCLGSFTASSREGAVNE